MFVPLLRTFIYIAFTGRAIAQPDASPTRLKREPMPQGSCYQTEVEEEEEEGDRKEMEKEKRKRPTTPSKQPSDQPATPPSVPPPTAAPPQTSNHQPTTSPRLKGTLRVLALPSA